MRRKQIAMRSFPGGNGTFASALEGLRDVVHVAEQVCAAAQAYLPAAETIVSLDPTGRAGEDWREEERWAVALTRLAIQQGAEPVEVRTTFGRCECRMASGLRFYWDRWEMEAGYTLGVAHPTGQFPPGSSLRLDLEASGWKINTYVEGRLVEEVFNAF